MLGMSPRRADDPQKITWPALGNGRNLDSPSAAGFLWRGRRVVQLVGSCNSSGHFSCAPSFSPTERQDAPRLADPLHRAPHGRAGSLALIGERTDPMLAARVWRTTACLSGRNPERRSRLFGECGDAVRLRCRLDRGSKWLGARGRVGTNPSFVAFPLSATMQAKGA